MTGEIALKVVGTTHEPAAMSVSDPSQPAQMNAQGYSLEVQAVSPTVTLTDVEGGTEMTVTDIHGSQTTLIPDGAQGPAGYTPVKGVDYFDGQNGRDGKDGNDGVSPTVTVTAIEGGNRITITDAGGEHTADVMDGPVGPQGPAGQDGRDGVSPTVAVMPITGGHRITVTDADGVRTVDVMDGNDGAAGAPGQDGQPGRDGQDGAPGQDGQDGVSPTITVTDIPGGHRVTITDTTGQHGFDVMDGEDGAAGAPGHDGVSPTASVAQTATGAIITTTDAHGTTSAEISNGPKGDPGDPTELIDDTAGDGETCKTWSADKLVDALADAGTVRDVQVDGVSVLDAQGVANVPQADGETFGVVKAGGYGVYNYIGRLRLEQPNAIQQQRGTDSTKAITPQVQHSAVFFGLAKAAGADMYSVSDVTIGQYPDEQKTAIRTMLGLDDQSIVDIVQAGLPAAEGVGF